MIETIVCCSVCYEDIECEATGLDSVGRPCAAEVDGQPIPRAADGGYLCPECDKKDTK